MKAYNCVDHNKLCKILKEMGIPDPVSVHLLLLFDKGSVEKNEVIFLCFSSDIERFSYEVE